MEGRAIEKKGDRGKKRWGNDEVNEDSENTRREKPPYQALALSVQHRNKASVDKVGMPNSGWAKRSWSIANLLLSRHMASIKLNSSDRIQETCYRFLILSTIRTWGSSRWTPLLVNTGLTTSID